MAKFHGFVGFSISEETTPGVWTETIVEKEYSGDIISNRRSWNNGESINDNLSISSTVSVIANDYMNLNLPNMKYVKWMGHKWKITTIEPAYPRMNLSIGGVYNGQ